MTFTVGDRWLLTLKPEDWQHMAKAPSGTVLPCIQVRDTTQGYVLVLKPIQLHASPVVAVEVVSFRRLS